MVTHKQKKVALHIIFNSTSDNPMNGGQIVQASGYSKSMALYPRKILESVGVKKELEKLGFTEVNAKTVVTEIMLNDKAKDSDRLKAASEIFKVEGSYAPEKRVNLNANATLPNEAAEAVVQEFEEKLKEELLDKEE